MFNFRIINTVEGNQIIDPSLKTPYSSLTPSQYEEYVRMDEQIYYMNRMKQKARKEAERKFRIPKKLLYKLACFCGLM